MRPARNLRRVSVVGRQREQLLELVDHEQQLAPGREDPFHDAADPELVPRELLDEVLRPLDRDPQERRGELLERVRAGEHVGDEPRFRCPAAPRRGAPGRARPGRREDFPLPDGPTTANQATGRPPPRTSSLDERRPAEEVGGVRLVERPQALVRVLRGRVRSRAPRPPGRRPRRTRRRSRSTRLVPLGGIGRGRASDDLVERGGQLRPDGAKRRSASSIGGRWPVSSSNVSRPRP